jgi:hypothetical protein
MNNFKIKAHFEIAEVSGNVKHKQQCAIFTYG